MIHLLNTFFCYRPSIGAEVFMFNSGPQKVNEISISHGSYLSLNLCIQLKNISKNTLSSIKEVHCIISVCPSHTFSSQSAINFNPCVSKEMVELNSKLLQHVKSISGGAKLVNTDEVEVGLVKSFVSFEINRRGQGFGSCLLNVCNFEVGLYQIKWCSGFVDEKGDYWSLLPLNAGVVFSIRKTEQKCT
jgi:integrator complex subunit 7